MAATGRDLDDVSSKASSPLLPPPPPPHTTQIPARLSLDFHRDGNVATGGSFDLSSVLSAVRGIDRLDRDGTGSEHSYEMVSRDVDDGGYFGGGGDEGTGIRSSRILVGKSSTPVSPLAVMNHRRNDLDTQLDGGTDRHLECVSVWDTAGDSPQHERRDNARMDGQKLEQDDKIPRSHSPPNNDAHNNRDYQDIHPALRVSEPEPQEGPYSVAGDFFRDFDGVHYTPEGATPPPPSATAPPHTCRDHHHQHYNSHHPPHPNHLQLPQLHPEDPRPPSYAAPENSVSETSRDSGLVYYPAPVPAVLNLPPLMAKDAKARTRLTKVQKRASQQVLSDFSASGEDKSGNRRSVVWSNNDNDARASSGAETASPSRKLDERRLSNLPPALRASAFFDSMQPAQHSVAPELKESSAVATLDSILDASASAPAAAFTDHPMTGMASTTHLHTTRNEYRNSVAMTVRLHPGESPRSSVDGGQDQQLCNSHSFEVPANNEGGNSLPTTLLAELESRKQQQKNRTRTAASAFPAGIRSTLLELDAVAQVQAQSRRQKRTQLAWEEPEDTSNNEDEDVPLGLLYQGHHVTYGMQRGRDEDVPLGLLMQKEMEDAEPLSKRRERLRQQAGHSTTPPPQIPQIPALEVEEVEEETLAQRMKRLKDTKVKEKRASTFGDGSLELSFDPATSRGATPPPEEETLAQRRKRLREEQERKKLSVEAKAVQAEVRKRASMATILHGQYGGGLMGPGLGGGMMGRSTPMLPMRPQTGGGMAGGSSGGGGLIHQVGQSMLRPQMSMGNMHGASRGVGGMGSSGMPGMNGMLMPGINGGMMPLGMNGGMVPLTPQEVTMNNKQREMVERWRASVR